MNTVLQKSLRFSLLLLTLGTWASSAFSQITVNNTWQKEWGPDGGPNPAGLDTAVTPNIPNRFGSVTIGDLDGDGDKDFISGSNRGTVHYFQNQGTITNPLWVLSNVITTLDSIDIAPIQTTNEVRPDLVDIDADGDLDLFIISRWNQMGLHKLDDIHFYRNIGTSLNPIFSKDTLAGIQFQQIAEFSCPAFGDLDNDGDLDFVIGGSDSCTYFENIGTSTLPAFNRNDIFPNSLWTETSFLAPTPDLEDFDNDGDLDLYFMNESGYIRYIPNNGTATVPDFSPYLSYPAHSFDTVDFGAFGSMDFEDVNGDGIKDLMASHWNPTKWYWYKGVSFGPTITVNSNVSCNGLLDGGATASITTGTPPYSYAWSNGATTASITSLGAGTYTITVTDNGSVTSTASVTITQPTSLVSAAAVTSTLSCNGNTDAQITASATGGTTPFTYSWNTGGTAALETGLGAGTYSVTITDQNGCTDSASTTVTQPTILVSAAVVTGTLSCNGNTDAQVTASATGGTNTNN
jgi:hypothetical protein